MRVLLMSVVMILAMVGPVSAGERFACNMNALTKEERATYQKVASAMIAAIQEKKELPNGYAFKLPPSALVTVAQWVAFERRCCPFFTFEMQVARDGGPVTLRITGTEGVKALMKMEFGI